MQEKLAKVKNRLFLQFNTEIPFTRNQDKDKAIHTHTTKLLPKMVFKTISLILINLRQFSKNPKIFLTMIIAKIITRSRNTLEILLKAKIDTIRRIHRQS